MPDHSERIEAIQSILRAGAKTVTIDGVTVQYDFNSLRKELRQLMAEDPAYAGRRPRVSSMDIGNAF
jgi:hypothetical protein